MIEASAIRNQSCIMLSTLLIRHSLRVGTCHRMLSLDEAHSWCLLMRAGAQLEIPHIEHLNDAAGFKEDGHAMEVRAYPFHLVQMLAMCWVLRLFHPFFCDLQRTSACKNLRMLCLCLIAEFGFVPVCVWSSNHRMSCSRKTKFKAPLDWNKSRLLLTPESPKSIRADQVCVIESQRPVFNTRSRLTCGFFAEHFESANDASSISEFKAVSTALVSVFCSSASV